MGGCYPAVESVARFHLLCAPTFFDPAWGPPFEDSGMVWRVLQQEATAIPDDCDITIIAVLGGQTSRQELSDTKLYAAVEGLMWRNHRRSST